jgi:carotenoid epsilon hydroxylase
MSAPLSETKQIVSVGGNNWRVRRQAVGPSMHRKYLAVMLDRVFGESALHLNKKLAEAAKARTPVNIEALFSQLTLDVIGKAVFNYDFDALEQDSTIIQAVYTALKETESRATDLLPYWKLSVLNHFVPRQRKAAAAVAEIRTTTEMLIARCKEMVNEEETRAAASSEEYINTEDPSILRFLIASRDEVSAEQLRDDLLGMLVAGHETTASVLTWTIFFLAQDPERMRLLQVCFSFESPGSA